MGAAPRPTTARRPLPYAEQQPGRRRSRLSPRTTSSSSTGARAGPAAFRRWRSLERPGSGRSGSRFERKRCSRRAGGPTARSSLSWAVTRFRPRRALAPQAEQQSSVRLLPSACVPGSTAATALAEATQRVVLAPGHASRDSEAVGLRGWPLLRRKRPPDRRRLRLLEGVRGRALHRDRPCS